MAQTRTDAFAAIADAKTGSAPLLLVRAGLAVGGTVYWTTRGGQYPAGGQYYRELLLDGITLTLGLDNIGRAQRAFGTLTLANAPDGAGARASDLFATETLSNAAVEIDYAFHGLTHPTDSLRIFTGALDVPDEDCFDDTRVRLQVLDDGNPMWAGIRNLSAARIHKTLGTPITAADYAAADPDALGRVQPIIYGSVSDSPCYAVDAGAMDLLSVDIDDDDTTITLSDTAKHALFPATGTVQIEDEQITYTGKGTLTLTGCTRGANATTAVAHVAGKQVYEIQATYNYLVAEHACKAIDAVRVDGVLIDPADYTTDLTGPTLIKFSVKAGKALSVTVTQQPDFSASVTAEQSPGAISTSAEQSPGAISTTAEQGVSTNTGSHGHTGDKGIHEYPNDPAVPWNSVSSSQDFTFVNSGKTGTTANWHVNVSATSGVWKIRKGGSDVATLSIGDNFFTEAATPGTDYELYESSAGTISVAMVERDLTITASTTSDAAAGVAASMTGATTTSMAALSGATASNMASLSGSTAVSLAQTQNVVVSAADIVVGTDVRCDVQGYADDGAGTYTGTPDALITNPADQIGHLLAVHLGLTLGDWADATSFTAARAAFAAASIRADWGLYAQIDSAELLERFRWSVAARLFQGAAGKFKLHVLPLSGASQKTYTETLDVLAPGTGGGATIKVGRTSMADLYNQVIIGGAKRVAGDGYATIITVEDAASQATYRMVRALLIENDFVRDATALDAIADIYLAWHKDQKWRATVAALGPPSVHLEPCDKISITSPRMPGGWSAKDFWIERISYSLLQPGRPDGVTLTVREV